MWPTAFSESHRCEDYEIARCPQSTPFADKKRSGDMGNHQSNDNNDQTELAAHAKRALENSGAAQFFPDTALRWDPFYLRALDSGARDLYEFLSFLAWKENSLVIKGAAHWLAKASNTGKRSVQRNLKRLMQVGLIRKHKDGYKKAHWYFVEPFLIGEYSWEGNRDRAPLEHLQASHLYQYRHGGGIKLVEIWSEMHLYRHGGGRIAPWWRCISESLGTECRHHGGQIYFFYSLLYRDALRQGVLTDSLGAPPNPPRGEEDQKGAPPDGGEDPTPQTQEEGVGHQADPPQTPASPRSYAVDCIRKEIKRLRDKGGEDRIRRADALETQISKMADELSRKKSVRGGTQSKSRASADFEGTPA